MTADPTPIPEQPTVCAWCDGERIGCAEGMCDATDGHAHPILDAGRPLTPSEAAQGWFAFHDECRPKVAALLRRLGDKGVSLQINGIEVRP